MASSGYSTVARHGVTCAPADHALGRSRGGFGTKLHLLTDVCGVPLGVLATAGQAYESKSFEALLDTVRLRWRRRLSRTYRYVKPIHVIVDNYSIHGRHQTTLALASLPRIQLHFLPPYAPEFNPIERICLDLHAEVARNHCCGNIEELLQEVECYLRYWNEANSQPKARRAA